VGAPLVVVLGHTKCGAVTAVVEHSHLSDSITKLVAPIVPAIERASKQEPKLVGAALVSAAIRENVVQSIHDLQSRSEIVRNAVTSGKLMIVGGVYDLHTGEIQWVDAAPVPATKISGTASSEEHTSAKMESDEAAHDPQPAHPADQDESKEPKKISASPRAKTRENYAALAGLLGAAAVGSSLAIRLVGGKRRG